MHGRPHDGRDSGARGISRREALRRGAVATAAIGIAPRALGTVTPGGRVVAARRGRPAAAAPPARRIVTRAGWGADERRRGAAAYDAVLEKVVIHHTGMDRAAADWPGEVRRIYEFETAAGYRDIAYHYLVDPDGTIYEGRWARDYPAGAAPDCEDGRGWLVRGGHALAHNARTLGIALLGDYRWVAPTPAAVEAIVELVAWRCGRWQVDPRGSSPYHNERNELVVLPNVVPHGQVRATECPGTLLSRVLPVIRERSAALLGDVGADGGYWLVSRDGVEIPFGDAPALQTGAPPGHAAGAATHPSGRGYWAFGLDGGVFAYGEAPFLGSLVGTPLNAPIVGLAPSATGQGYWLASADGGVFAFGDARFHGSLAASGLRAPVAGICAHPGGGGYWCVGRDGGVFAFGDAPYLGSAAAATLNAPVVAMAATRHGYWLAAEDGGVFAFGDAPYLGGGSTGAPIRAIAPTRTGRGYLLVSSAGDVLPFGDASYHGGAAGLAPEIVGVAGLIEPR